MIFATLAQLVDPLRSSLPPPSEVVVHDLSLLPDSIVAIAGDLTGRKVGDPATDLLLRRSASQDFETAVGYETTLTDGRRMMSSTVIVRDEFDRPAAALCVNSDVSVWEAVANMAGSMLGFSWNRRRDEPAADGVGPSEHRPAGVGPGSEQSESFVRDVDELAELLITEAIEETGVPVDLMHKIHKLAVVRSLKASGMFMLRDAVDRVAAAISVSRFTIYNYLNEIDAENTDENHSEDKESGNAGF
jgi:predicted transcriptional regulator YheO